MHTHSLADYTACLERGDWPGVGRADAATRRRSSRQTGADFLICPDNTIHNGLPHLEGRSPLPWLHIAEVVAEAGRSAASGAWP